MLFVIKLAVVMAAITAIMAWLDGTAKSRDETPHAKQPPQRSR